MTKPTKWVCTHRRPTSACTSAQSDQPSLCAQWGAKDISFLHADSEDSDQTGRMPRPIWVFAGRTVILFVLSCCGSIYYEILQPDLAETSGWSMLKNVKETNLIFYFILQTFPEKLAIIRLGNIREDSVLLTCLHCVWVCMVVRTRTDSEETSLWVDAMQHAVFVKPHPGNVIPNTLYFVARKWRHQHGHVSFTTSARESCGNECLSASFLNSNTHNLYKNQRPMDTMAHLSEQLKTLNSAF